MDSTHPDSSDRWRATHLGCLMGRALERFDARVRQLISASAEAPLALSNLAARDQVGAAPIHITRHLPLEGARITELARRAGTTKQSMSALVRECEAWGLVARAADPHDARAQRIVFTAAGLDWLAAYKTAVLQAESEFQAAVGAPVTTVIKLGLEAYGSGG